MIWSLTIPASSLFYLGHLIPPCLFLCLLIGLIHTKGNILIGQWTSGVKSSFQGPHCWHRSWPWTWAVLMVLLVGPLVSVPGLLLLGKGFTTQTKAPSSGRHHLHCRCTHYQSSPIHVFHECVAILLVQNKLSPVKSSKFILENTQIIQTSDI